MLNKLNRIVETLFYICFAFCLLFFCGHAILPSFESLTCISANFVEQSYNILNIGMLSGLAGMALLGLVWLAMDIFS